MRVERPNDPKPDAGGADPVDADANRSDETIATPMPGDPTTSPTATAKRHFPKIEGYQITSILGHGGMGIVYRAVQVKLNRIVALKVLPAVVGTANPSAVKRFRREASAAARLHHTNIVPIYDYGESRDSYFYAMELISGQPLSALIPKLSKNDLSRATPARLIDWLHRELSGTPLVPVDNDSEARSRSRSDGSASSVTVTRKGAYFHQVARWMADAADALHYAHNQQIIHRDIKPGNLLLSANVRIMIADFGLAKTGEDESYTMTGTLIGTLRYLSPEQAMAKRIRVDHRTDIYSLGATMYELLCFQSAFPGTDEKEILGSIIARDPVSPQRMNGSVPGELATICLKCMEKSPDARYETAKGLADDLRRFLHDLPITARPPGPIRRVRKFFRRNKAAAIVSAAVALLAVASVIFGMSFRQRKAALHEQQTARIHGLLNSAETLSDARKPPNERDYPRAVELYEEVLHLDQNNTVALGNLARVKKDWFNEVRDADPSLLVEANELCDRALALEPDRTRVWIVKGVVLKKLENYEAAAAAYREAIKLNPNHSPAWENLGIVQALDGKLREARENLLHACELAGTSEQQCVFPWRNLVAVELHLGDPNSLPHVENALVCRPTDAVAQLLRARCRLALSGADDAEAAVRDADGALFLAERTREDDRTRGRIQRVIALARLRAGHFQEAIEAATVADSLGDIRAFDYLITAIAETKLGSRSAAMVHLDMAINEWPESLEEPGAFVVTAPAGVLWIESADALFDLRDEAEAALKLTADRP